MRFAIIGGDLRAVRLAELLLRDGNRVRSFCLEQAALPGEVTRESSLQGAVYGADCVLLPTPLGRDGLLNAPLSEEKLPLEELIGGLWPGQLVFGGGFGDELLRRARKGKLLVTDLLRRPDFCVGNALLTAEGALGLLIRESEGSIFGARALVCGWGRIGRLLALRLRALGAETAVAARAAEDRACATALGLEALRYEELEERIGGFELLVNTVPARVLTDAMLCCVSPDALLLELASPPGGFDRTLAENIGLRCLAAPGLPGKTAPLGAARLYRVCLERIFEEREFEHV